MTTRDQDPYFAIDLDDRCYCRGHGNDPNATVCAPHEALGDALNAFDLARPKALAAPPCPCWVETHSHGGHCCFRPLSDLGGDPAPWLDDVLFDAIERDLLPYCHSEDDAAEHRRTLQVAAWLAERQRMSTEQCMCRFRGTDTVDVSTPCPDCRVEIVGGALVSRVERCTCEPVDVGVGLIHDTAWCGLELIEPVPDHLVAPVTPNG